ncbi:MAG: methionyl-tRNA formyltransferase [Alphaproteobacteria bacterium]|nr:methionyl-tRNA formyltransferase [Alphaproteobacteria bacterium]
MRLAFLGTPDFAAATLAALIAAGHEIAAVYSQPPRPSGRGQRLVPTPTMALAEHHGLPVRTPISLRDPTEQAAFASLDLDVAVVAAYGLILPLPILNAPRRGCLNVHGSLLPRWRGAAPIQRALMAGDAETGVTIMQMDKGLDTGAMLLAEAVPITSAATGGSLHDDLAALGARLMVQALATLDTLTPTPQPTEGVTYADKLGPADRVLVWERDAEVLARQVRAMAPRPGVQVVLAGEVMRVLAATAEPLPARVPASATPGTVLDTQLGILTGNGVLRLERLQRPGRSPVDRQSLLNGCSIPAGTVAGLPPAPAEAARQT